MFQTISFVSSFEETNETVVNVFMETFPKIYLQNGTFGCHHR